MLFLPTKSSLLGSMSGGISFGMSAMESVTTMVLVGTWKNVASLRPTSRPPSAKDPDLRILTSISSSHGGVFPAPPPTAASPSTPVGAATVYPFRGYLHRERELPGRDPQVRFGPPVTSVLCEYFVLQRVGWHHDVFDRP